MINTTVPSGALRPPQERLPRRLGRRYALSLVVVEALVCFGSTTFLLAPRGLRVGEGMLLALLYCSLSALLGRYRRSFAVYPRDEAYYVLTPWFAASLIAITAMTALGRLSWHSALFVCVASGFFLIAVNALLARAHGADAVYNGTVDKLSAESFDARASRKDRAALRAFDLAAGSLATLVFLPVMAIVALAVYVDSRGPVLFRQDRVGRDGRIFRICKFRTMTTNAGGNWVRPGDNRITRIGAFLRRTSLDELPQLFNVLRGEMSVVGPRPEMREYAGEFASMIPNYDQRHIVRPGITGWAQLYMKRNLEPSDVPDVLRCDLFYVEHASVSLNIAIVVKTAFEVLFHRAV